MKDLLKLILGVLASLFRSRAKLEAENLVLRQQINVLRRRMPKRPDLNNTDRLLLVWLYRWFPCVLGAIVTVRFTVAGVTSLRCDLAMGFALPALTTVRIKPLLRNVASGRANAGWQREAGSSRWARPPGMLDRPGSAGGPKT
jgi:hypothetical protein